MPQVADFKTEYSFFDIFVYALDNNFIRSNSLTEVSTSCFQTLLGNLRSYLNLKWTSKTILMAIFVDRELVDFDPKIMFFRQNIKHFENFQILFCFKRTSFYLRLLYERGCEMFFNIFYHVRKHFVLVYSVNFGKKIKFENFRFFSKKFAYVVTILVETTN